jgi:hypothetical protein
MDDKQVTPLRHQKAPHNQYSTIARQAQHGAGTNTVSAPPETADGPPVSARP